MPLNVIKTQHINDLGQYSQKLPNKNIHNNGHLKRVYLAYIVNVFCIDRKRLEGHKPHYNSSGIMHSFNFSSNNIIINN